MKKLVIFLSISLFFSLGMKAQTLSTDTFANGSAPAVADTIAAPIDITSIGGIFTITVYYEYDNTVLEYVDTANASSEVAKFTISEPVSGVIKVLGESPSLSTPMTLSDATLIKLKFKFLGGNSDLKFHTSDYGTYTSNLLKDDYSTFNFADADVTNGSVQGGYTDNAISGGDWNTATNWTLGVVPNSWHNVTVNAGTETTINNAAYAHNLTIAVGGQLTLNSTLTLGGDMLMQSDATGDASFIGEGSDVTVAGTVTAQRYETDGQWHGFSSPVSGADFMGTFFHDNPFVWVRDFDESTGTYPYLSDTLQVLDDMGGYFAWVQTATSPVTFTFEGSLRSGTIGSTNNMVNANTGHNFVGNPFTSAIDWDADSGWKKTNLYGAIYVYNNGNWASYIGTTGINGGSKYIAEGQGFFVQVNAATGTNGTLQMTKDVCVHNSVSYLKNVNALDQEIVRLKLTVNDKSDETVIRFSDDATADYDADLDAHKFFSFNADYPQIYSTANDFMSINSLPFDANKSIPMDVRGKDGDVMTISATEAEGVEFLNLKDNFTGVTTNLKTGDYTFTYNSSVVNRFELYFGFLGVDETPVTSYANIFAAGQNVNVKLIGSTNANITIYNLLGQTIDFRSASSTFTSIPVEKTGYYVVKVNDGLHVTTQKVFIK